jgi:hypothetical protein
LLGVEKRENGKEIYASPLSAIEDFLQRLYRRKNEAISKEFLCKII